MAYTMIKNDSVEIAPELQGAAEEASMKRQVCVACMSEMDGARSPVLAEQGARVAREDTDREFDRLPRRGTRFNGEFLPDGDRFARGLDVDGQGLVEQMPVFGRGQQHLAQRALVREQDIDHAGAELLARFRPFAARKSGAKPFRP
jgi:hypothetical protein